MASPITIDTLNDGAADLVTIGEVTNSPALTATGRLGNTTRTLAGIDAEADDTFEQINVSAETQRDAIQAAADVILAAAGYAVPVPYAAGLNMNVPNQTVTNGGEVYAPKSADLPFVTSGVFEAAKFRLIQGVAGVDLLSGVGAAMVGFQQLGSASLGDVMRKLTDIVDIFDFIPKSEHANIRNGTSAYDCYAKIMEAINSRTNWAGIYVSGPSIYFPAGKYICNQCIQIKRMVKLWSHGSGMPGAPQASITFPAGVSGVIIHRYNTIGAIVEAPTTTGGDGAILEGLQFVGAYSAAPDAMGGHGLWLRARGVIRQCMFSGFSGDGGRTVSSSGGGGAVEGNANGWVVQYCRFQNNGGWGWEAAGADANAGTGIGIDCSQNGNGGLWDNSFLGNTYIQPQCAGDGSGNAGHNLTRGRSSLVWYAGQRWTAVYPATDAQLAATVPGTDSTIWAPGTVIAFGNPTHPLWVAGSAVGTYFASNSYRFTNVNSRGIVVNPYEEGGYSPAYSTGPTLLLGGALSGFVGFSRILGSSIGPTTPGTFTMDKSLIVTSHNMLDTSGLFTWELFKQLTTTPGRRSSYWAGVERDIFTLYDRGVTVANGYPRELSTSPGGNSGTLGLGAHYFGSRTQMKFRGLIAAAPGAGLTVLQGDHWHSLTPAAAGKIGWCCTTAGTTGSTAVIKQWGAIDA